MEEIRKRWIAGLGHPEERIRNVALMVLADDRDAGLDATRAALAAVERWGWVDAFDHPFQLGDLSLDMETAEWVLRALEADEPPATLHGRLLGWLESAREAVREPFRARLEALLGAPSGRDAPTRLAAAIMAELEALAITAGEKEEFPHEEIAEIEDLVAEMEKLPPSPELIGFVREWLERDPDKGDWADYWRVGAAVLGAGFLRLEDAIPAIIAAFDDDGDWINENIQKALVRMGTQTCAEMVVEHYAAAGEWYERLYLLGVLERLRFPALEPRLLEMAEAEEDDELRVRFAHTLALYGTPRAMNRAIAIVEEIAEDAERMEVLGVLYAQDVLSGNPPIGRQLEWRETLDAEEAAAAERIYDAPFSRLARGEHGSYVGGAPPATPETVVNDGPKIGRNDPCPCGSGKKYKKCCGKTG